MAASRREPKAKTPKPVKIKPTGTKAPPVLPTGHPCIAEGCDKPALGDEFCSRACLSRTLGIVCDYDEAMARGGKASAAKARAAGTRPVRAGKRELALSA